MFVSNLGDATPLNFGGYFVFKAEERREGEPENARHSDYAIYFESPHDEGGDYFLYEFLLDKCTYIDGTLSDNPSHPDHPAWFAEDLGSVAEHAGYDLSILRDKLCGENVVGRAAAYGCIADYHGWENLDSYPLTLSRAAVIEFLKTRGVPAKVIGR